MEALGHADEMLKNAEAAAAAGLGKTSADINRARTEVAIRRPELLNTQARNAAASACLARLLRLKPTIDLIPADATVVPLTLVPPNFSDDALVAMGQSRRPEVRNACGSIAAADVQWSEAKMAPWLPKLEVGYTAGSFGGGPNDQFADFGPRSDGGRRPRGNGTTLGWATVPACSSGKPATARPTGPARRRSRSRDRRRGRVRREGSPTAAAQPCQLAGSRSASPGNLGQAMGRDRWAGGHGSMPPQLRRIALCDLNQCVAFDEVIGLDQWNSACIGPWASRRCVPYRPPRPFRPTLPSPPRRPSRRCKIGKLPWSRRKGAKYRPNDDSLRFRRDDQDSETHPPKI